MTVKGHLKSICALEKEKHEAELALKKMLRTKDAKTREVESKKAALKKPVDAKKIQIDNSKQDIKRMKQRAEPSVKSEVIVSLLLLGIFVILELFIKYLLIDVMRITDVATVICNLVFVYGGIAVLVFFLLRVTLIDDLWLGIACGLGLIAVLVATYFYLDYKVSSGLDISAAIACMYIGLDVLYAIGAAIFCISKYIEYSKAFEANLQKIKVCQKSLSALEQEYLVLKKKLDDFDRTSQKAIGLMQKDVESQEAKIKSMQTRLSLLYSQNILHPNYHNWVAASTIYEYLDVGRCYELQGPHGAYNLYEQELIAKKIVSSLADINSGIRKYGYEIANAQKYIRAQLNECNRKVDMLMVNTHGI